MALKPSTIDYVRSRTTASRVAGLISLTVVAACCSLSTALATTLVRLSLEQMTGASTAIVRGHVVSQDTRWNPQHTEILTYTTIAVENVIKGQPPSSVVVEQLGGTIGHFRVHVAGTVHFSSGVSYLLFLEPAGEDAEPYLVVGMAQGAYRIYQDPVTHEERVVQPLGDIYYGNRSGTSLTQGTAPLKRVEQQVSTALVSPVAVPSGTLLAVRIEATHSLGVGRLAVLGRTTTEVYPSPTVVIPAGSEVEGTAARVADTWRIRWTDVSIRGARAPFAAASEAPARESLGGKLLVVRVR